MARGTNSSIGEAISWASRLIAVGIIMFLPAVAGGWADSQLGTSWLAACGLAAGFGVGLFWLLRLAAGREKR